MLTDEQCNEFRRLPMSFNDMVRAIYEAGRASKAAEYAHIRREARNAALEEAAKICKREEELMASAGMKHPEDSHSRDRCFARSRTAGALYNAIRALKDQP